MQILVSSTSEEMWQLSFYVVQLMLKCALVLGAGKFGRKPCSNLDLWCVDCQLSVPYCLSFLKFQCLGIGLYKIKTGFSAFVDRSSHVLIMWSLLNGLDFSLWCQTCTLTCLLTISAWNYTRDTTSSTYQKELFFGSLLFIYPVTNARTFDSPNSHHPQIRILVYT